MTQLKRPLMDFDVGSSHTDAGQLTGVLALPSGNALVIHRNLNSDLQYTVLKVQQHKNQLVHWFSSADITELIRAPPFIYVLHQHGRITKCHENQLSSDGCNTFKVNISSFGQGDYVNDIRGEYLLLPDQIKGRICTFDLDEQRLDVVVSGLDNPSSISVNGSTGYPIYYVTEKGKHRVSLYNHNWKLIKHVTKAQAQLNQPMSTTTLPSGHFLLADAGTNQILEFDNHGVYVSTILDENDGICSPASVSYSHPYLWITSNEQKQTYNVKRFTLYHM